MNTNGRALKRAVKAAGGQSALARKLGIKRQAVGQWLAGTVPIERCVAIEFYTGVTRKELRPDIFA